ncbi:MAG: hypothetical protein ABSH20_08950 [Tepidisphaeraceae bacterium]|jgi:hypothetical protein
MGVDALDLVFRLEKSFGIKLPYSNSAGMFDVPGGVTAGHVHDFICRRLTESGRRIPFSSWHRVQLCISRAVGVPPQQVKRESRLVKDLGMC